MSDTIDSLTRQRNALDAALRAVETHHIEINARAGKSEDDSRTLRIVRDGLAKAYAAWEGKKE